MSDRHVPVAPGAANLTSVRLGTPTCRPDPAVVSSLLAMPARSLTLEEATYVLIHLHQSDLLKLVASSGGTRFNFLNPTFDTHCGVALPQQRVFNLHPLINGVVFWLYHDPVRVPDRTVPSGFRMVPTRHGTDAIRGCDVRMAVLLYKLTVHLKARHGVTDIAYQGIGSAGRPGTTDNHSEGRGLDLHTIFIPGTRAVAAGAEAQPGSESATFERTYEAMVPSTRRLVPSVIDGYDVLRHWGMMPIPLSLVGIPNEYIVRSRDPARTFTVFRFPVGRTPANGMNGAVRVRSASQWPVFRTGDWVGVGSIRDRATLLQAYQNTVARLGISDQRFSNTAFRFSAPLEYWEADANGQLQRQVQPADSTTGDFFRYLYEFMSHEASDRIRPYGSRRPVVTELYSPETLHATVLGDSSFEGRSQMIMYPDYPSENAWERQAHANHFHAQIAMTGASTAAQHPHGDWPSMRCQNCTSTPEAVRAAEREAQRILEIQRRADPDYDPEDEYENAAMEDAESDQVQNAAGGHDPDDHADNGASR